jgi:hypothetical protein
VSVKIRKTIVSGANLARKHLDNAPAVESEKAIVVDRHDDVSEQQEKTDEIGQAEYDCGNAFSGGFESLAGCSDTTPGNRPFSKRTRQPPRPLPFLVSRILRWNARSRVRLTDRALSLKQRASDHRFSLS